MIRGVTAQPVHSLHAVAPPHVWCAHLQNAATQAIMHASPLIPHPKITPYNALLSSCTHQKEHAPGTGGCAGTQPLHTTAHLQETCAPAQEAAAQKQCPSPPCHLETKDAANNTGIPVPTRHPGTPQKALLIYHRAAPVTPACESASKPLGPSGVFQPRGKQARIDFHT